MITKTDCLLLLGELAENGIDTSKIYPVALNYNGVNPQVVKFINSHRRFEANKFYGFCKERFAKDRIKELKSYPYKTDIISMRDYYLTGIPTVLLEEKS